MVAKKFTTKKLMEGDETVAKSEGVGNVVDDDKSDSEDEEGENEVVLSRQKDKV